MSLLRKLFGPSKAEIWSQLSREIGDAEFDEAFVLQGNDEHKVRALLAAPRIRELLDAQPQIHLQIWDDQGWFGASFPEGVDELRFSTHGVIKDVERLKRLFDLFSEVLQQLCRMGSAYEEDPGVPLP